MSNPFEQQIVEVLTVPTSPVLAPSLMSLPPPLTTLLLPSDIYSNHIIPQTAFNNSSTYFNQAGASSSDWWIHKAGGNVDINGFDLDNVNSVIFTPTSGTLDVDASGNLRFNGSAVIQDASNWSHYPALQDVNFGNFKLVNVKQIDMSGNINMNNQGGINNCNFIDLSGNINFNNNGSLLNLQAINMTGNLTMNSNGLTALRNAQRVQTQTVYLGPEASGNILSTDASLNLLYRGQIINAGASGNVANWSTYPAISNVTMGNNSLNFTGGLTGYSTSQFDTNIHMGDASYLVGPDFIAYPYNFQVGSLATGAHSISMTSVGSISLTSATGVNITGAGGASITGGVGLTLTGGGGITATGATINLTGGTITLGAGSISALGGIINLGSGSVNIGSGLLNILTGNIAIGSGAIEIGTGAIVIGTASTPGGGIQAYGGKIISSPSGVGPGGVSVRGTASLDTNAIIPGNLGYLNITGLDSSTNPVQMNNISQLTSAPLSNGMVITNVNTITGNSGGLALTNVSTINGSAYPPTTAMPTVTLSYPFTSPFAFPLNVATPTYLNPPTPVSISGSSSSYAYLITGNIRIIDGGGAQFAHPSTWDFDIGFFDSSGTFPPFQQLITIARGICPHNLIGGLSNAFELPFSGFLTSDMGGVFANPSDTYTLKIFYNYFPVGPDGPTTYYLDLLNCCIQRMY